MATLIIESNLADPDGFYEALINAHRDLTTAQSHAMNAALVLLLTNHIGDLETIEQAFAHAREAAFQPERGTATDDAPTR